MSLYPPPILFTNKILTPTNLNSRKYDHFNAPDVFLADCVSNHQFSLKIDKECFFTKMITREDFKKYWDNLYSCRNIIRTLILSESPKQIRNAIAIFVYCFILNPKNIKIFGETNNLKINDKRVSVSLNYSINMG